MINGDNVCYFGSKAKPDIPFTRYPDSRESIIAKVMELQNKENTNIPLYEKQLRDAESGIQNMLNAIQAGILTSSTKERLEQLEETKRELEARDIAFTMGAKGPLLEKAENYDGEIPLF